MEIGSKRARIAGVVLGLTAIAVSAAFIAMAGEPMFVQWLAAEDPGDQTIRDYWERAERDELDPAALVDLGTMLFYRGFPNDALTMFKRALDLDSDLYEAWFRIGLVEHSEGDLDNARQAYKRCLKKRPGHGWCNFYLGLLEEQLGHSSSALHHYGVALEHAPELSDPNVNPEVMSSQLMLGVHLQSEDARRFKNSLPMRYLEPGQVAKVRRRYEPTPTPSPAPVQEPGAIEAQAPPPSKAKPAQPQPTRAQPVRPPRPAMPRRATTPTPYAR